MVPSGSTQSCGVLKHAFGPRTAVTLYRLFFGVWTQVGWCGLGPPVDPHPHRRAPGNGRDGVVLGVRRRACVGPQLGQWGLAVDFPAATVCRDPEGVNCTECHSVDDKHRRPIHSQWEDGFVLVAGQSGSLTPLPTLLANRSTLHSKESMRSASPLRSASRSAPRPAEPAPVCPVLVRLPLRITRSLSASDPLSESMCLASPPRPALRSAPRPTAPAPAR